MLTQIKLMTEELRSVRRDLHRHPELAYHEKRTAGVVAQLLRKWDIEVHERIGRTGIDPANIAVLSITRIAGGTTHNAMPPEVQLMGIVRTFDPAVQDKLESALRN